MITHPEMVKKLVKDPQEIIDTLTLKKVDMWHAATGIGGEGPELLAGFFDDPHKGVDAGNVMEELGDIEFYVQQLVSNTGITRTIPEKAQGLSPVKVAIACGNVLDIVKKHVVYDQELNEGKLTAAVAELDHAMAAIRARFHWSRDDVLDHNIEKLSRRYKGLKYTDDAAKQRADKADA